MKYFWEEAQEKSKKKINKKKIIIISLIIIILIASITIAIIYFNNEQAREWIDRKILKKEVIQDNTITIELTNTENSKIYAYDKNIGILNRNTFSIYNNTGDKEKDLEIQISNPIFDSANRFLAIAENKGQKLYIIENKNIAWETEIEGNISQIHINKNGYVAVVIVDTSYKTVIDMYNQKGERLFKKFLSSTRIADLSISNDNKYLAIAEVDTSGTMIQSNVKIMSIEKTESSSEGDIEETYQGKEDKLICSIKYQNKNRLICMYTDSIIMIEEKQEKVLIDNEDKKVIFQTIDLDNHIASVQERSSGLFTADSVVEIINTENQTSKEYTTNSLTTEIYSAGNIIAINIGTEIEFINTNGWLAKRYKANQEITNIAISDSIVGIIYRDKIEIINL